MRVRVQVANSCSLHVTHIEEKMKYHQCQYLLQCWKCIKKSFIMRSAIGKNNWQQIFQYSIMGDPGTAQLSYCENLALPRPWLFGLVHYSHLELFVSLVVPYLGVNQCLVTVQPWRLPRSFWCSCWYGSQVLKDDYGYSLTICKHELELQRSHFCLD